jgi:hypothetical protein
MTYLAISLAIYFTIPVVAILISGRKITPLGWLVFILLWPIGWMFPEELP